LRLRQAGLRLSHSASERRFTQADIGRFLTERRLAKYKIPERIDLTDAFAVTRVGTIDKVRRPADRREDPQ
jgi:non-ribosomal peptide synthetase component E (peptide arylation enzyme)